MALQSTRLNIHKHFPALCSINNTLRSQLQYVYETSKQLQTTHHVPCCSRFCRLAFTSHSLYCCWVWWDWSNTSICMLTWTITLGITVVRLPLYKGHLIFHRSSVQCPSIIQLNYTHNLFRRPDAGQLLIHCHNRMVCYKLSIPLYEYSKLQESVPCLPAKCFQTAILSQNKTSWSQITTSHALY